MTSEGEAYAIAFSIDRGDGSKLAALIKERDQLRAQAADLLAVLSRIARFSGSEEAIIAQAAIARVEKGKQ